MPISKIKNNNKRSAPKINNNNKNKKNLQTIFQNINDQENENEGKYLKKSFDKIIILNIIYNIFDFSST
jgi:hypothetical protein